MSTGSDEQFLWPTLLIVYTAAIASLVLHSPSLPTEAPNSRYLLSQTPLRLSVAVWPRLANEMTVKSVSLISLASLGALGKYVFLWKKIKRL